MEVTTQTTPVVEVQPETETVATTPIAEEASRLETTSMPSGEDFRAEALQSTTSEA